MSEGPIDAEEHARRSKEIMKRILERIRKRQAAGGQLPRVREPVELPDDEWHSHVYVHCSWLACESCKAEPDLNWAWNGVASGEPGVATFTIRAVDFLKDDGWQIDDGSLWCPACASIRFPKT
jgi:hypothetical protein